MRKVDSGAEREANHKDSAVFVQVMCSAQTVADQPFGVGVASEVVHGFNQRGLQLLIVRCTGLWAAQDLVSLKHRGSQILGGPQCRHTPVLVCKNF